ncbi:Crp/Fnr family transcriptional regulator [Lutibacter sp.]|uniref:Crp/Fnr family transcriptional regulator n=1 Tax=Lutibacter sp. TaxID=1925666 RepID=UPI0025C0C08B|nr:Crp/Fnr family transcriptional regulator [Lutibacter sp.]MCF6167484.1 Crp/Fnr family transcriptional regulator [Lutibacter sp.]
MSNVWFLENVNLFKILCPHKFKAYKDSHNFNYYSKNDYIYFEEDASNKVYLIEKGKVKLGYYNEDGSEIVKAVLCKGELFGEKAILGEEKRNEFAQSTENKTSICPIGVSTLHDLMRDNQTFTLKIYKFINFRIKKLERRLQMLLFKDAKTRLLDFLGELSEEFGTVCSKTGKIKIQHPYTQKDIANLIGTSRPTLNISLNELKEEGVLNFNRNEIILLKNTPHVS